MANNIDYSKRSFSYYPTDAIVVARCIDGKWTEPEVTDDFRLSVHCFAGVFHYAPSCFEGAKAYMGADGKVRLFRPEENAKRMIRSAKYLDMPYPPVEMFVDMCIRCVQANWNHIPPYESGASLYLRPVLFGYNPQLGIKSADDTMFVVMASGVGTYSGDKILSPGTAVLSRNYDRAATYGSGGYKLGANYAQSLHAYNIAHNQGYRELLFLDSATHTHIEEFGSSNFFAIKDNTYIPPYESGASLYLRPVLFGINPQLGIKSSDDTMFVVMASGVGTYSGDKILSPGTAVISRNYDRAATYGSGGYKLGANYAQSLHAYNIAHNQGYRELLFLDSATHTHIEEFGSSNFFAIKDNTYITPDSESVLPSITNMSLRTVAAEFGLKVERRKVYVEELAGFEEVNSCGTAVVITPICRIDDKPVLEGAEITRSYHIGDPTRCGTVSRRLYDRVIGIQKGLEEDTYGWCLFVDRK